MTMQQLKAMPRLVSLLLLAVAAAGAPLRSKHVAAHSFVRSLELKQVLRVCNAYPFTSALDVFVGKTKVTETPLAYKSCGEFAPALSVGDRVDFKVGESNAGTFTISDLPNSDAVLLMVIYRHDTVSTAVSFESHVFASLQSAQIAVLDTYKGTEKSELRIQDMLEKKPEGEEVPGEIRSELLRFDSVVAVDPGQYEVMLVGEKAASKSELVAAKGEAYVVMRCGCQAEEGPAYPQDLMVYPHTDKKALGAATRSFGSPLLAAALALWAAMA